jgi:hypothetical protein
VTTDPTTQLQRELDDSRNRGRLPPPSGRHRAFYALPTVLVIAVLGGVAAYAISSMVLKAGVSTTWAYVISGFAITAVAWGLSGVNTVRASTTDRFVDVAVAVVVGSVVLGIAQPPPLFRLFAAMPKHDATIGTSGIDGMPRFHQIFAWAAVAACCAFAVSALGRLALERLRLRGAARPRDDR